MADPLVFPSPITPPRPPEQDDTGKMLDELAWFAATAGRVYLAFCDWVQGAAHEAELNHLRRERLVAYRVRHRWKAGDAAPLLSLGINKAAQCRMARLEGRGRPVVRPHRPLEEVLRGKLIAWSCLFHTDAMPDERRRAFKAWPWWKHHVEALYRGELELARAGRVKGAHDHAERTVAVALRMSQGKVRAICGEIRALRREDADAANFPPMVLAEYEGWMERGKLAMRLEV